MAGFRARARTLMIRAGLVLGVLLVLFVLGRVAGAATAGAGCG